MSNKSSEFLQFKLRPWGLLSAVGSVLCIASITGFAGRYWWLLDLTSHFRVQYLFLLAVLVLIFSLARKFKTVAILTLFALVNLFYIIPAYFPSNSSIRNSGNNHKVLLLNVSTSNNNYELVLKVIRGYGPDFIILEEVDYAWIAKLSILEENYHHSLLRPRTDNFGIALYSKFPFTKAEIVYIGEAEVPSLITGFNINNTRFSILGTHPLPPGSAENSRLRNEQLLALSKYVRDLDNSVIVFGDLNSTPWSYHFRNLLKQSGLRDSCRGYGIQTTWPSFFFPLRIPLDHCLHSPGIAIMNREIGPNVGSDHFPVIVEFTVTVTKDENKQRNADSGLQPMIRNRLITLMVHMQRKAL